MSFRKILSDFRGRAMHAPTEIVHRHWDCAKSNRARADNGIRPYEVCFTVSSAKNARLFLQKDRALYFDI